MFKFRDGLTAKRYSDTPTIHTDTADEKINLVVVIFFLVAGLAALIYAFCCH